MRGCAVPRPTSLSHWRSSRTAIGSAAADGKPSGWYLSSSRATLTSATYNKQRCNDTCNVQHRRSGGDRRGAQRSIPAEYRDIQNVRLRHRARCVVTLQLFLLTLHPSPRRSPLAPFPPLAERHAHVTSNAYDPPTKPRARLTAQRLRRERAIGVPRSPHGSDRRQPRTLDRLGEMERLRGAAAATSIMIGAGSRARSIRRRCATCCEHLQAQRHVGRSRTSLAHSAAAVEPWLQPQPWPPSRVAPLCSPAASPPSNARTLTDTMQRRTDGRTG